MNDIKDVKELLKNIKAKNEKRDSLNTSSGNVKDLIKNIKAKSEKRNPITESSKVNLHQVKIPKIKENFRDVNSSIRGKIEQMPELYKLTNEDLYMEGSGLSNTYPKGSDGECCRMVEPKPKGLPMKYYTPNMGRNPRTFIPPVIPPRIIEQDYFSYPTSTLSNFSPVKDITELDLGEQPFIDSREVFDERDGGCGGCGECDQCLGERTNRGECDCGGNCEKCRRGDNGREHFSESFFRDENDLFHRSSKKHKAGDEETFRDDFEFDAEIDLHTELRNRVNNVRSRRHEGKYSRDGIYLEEGSMNDQVIPLRNLTLKSIIERDDPGLCNRVHKPVTYRNGRSALPLNLLPTPGVSRNKCDRDQSKYDMMFSKTPIKAYSDIELNRPENSIFLQDVEPNVFSYTNQQTPINHNLGITETPQIPPRMRDEICSPIGNYPLFTRIDPQLVRDDLMPGEQIYMPDRSPWSAKNSEFEAGAGTLNYENIYDPRGSGGYGDAYRAYSDIDLGQVQYYYSDIDAYKAPNFIIRNKVSHIDFHTPNGAVQPYYLRDVALDDIKEEVEDQFLADSISHREDMMERLMRKRNSELWQLRSAPIQTSHTNNWIN